MKKCIFLNVIVPIVVGAFLYYLFFPDVGFVKLTDKLIGISCHIPLKLDNILIKSIRFYLFDYLWAYSLMSLVSILFKESKDVYVIVLLFVLVMEIIQLVPGIPGTFDVFDVVIEMIACLIAIRMNKRRVEL